MPVGLAVLDLSPVLEGGTARQALLDTLDLARTAEAAGYTRYWLAEHHLAPGVAGSSPEVLIGAVAAATDRIRVGSGAVLLGHRTPLSVVEAFGVLDALYPGRIDAGLGRSGFRRLPGTSGFSPPASPSPAPAQERTVDGLLIPVPFSWTALAGSPLLAATAELVQQPGADTPDFGAAVDAVRELLAGTHRDSRGTPVHATPGTGADVELWLLGSSGSGGAVVAGERGLRFAANYHVAPASVLDAVQAYRTSFRPSAELERPYLVVSVDAVVAPTDDEARDLAAGYGRWVLDIRRGVGAQPYPSAAAAAAYDWSDDDRALVSDRVRTQVVGSPTTAVERLATLARVTGADELLVTTITPDHESRVRSYRLLAQAWAAAGVEPAHPAPLVAAP